MYELLIEQLEEKVAPGGGSGGQQP